MKNIQIHLLLKMVFAAICLSFLWACASQDGISINFKVYVDGQELEYGKSYASPNGDGTYTINDFKLFISNLKLIGDDHSDINYTEKESYHLLKFQDKNSYSFDLEYAPTESYERIQFSIGIDEEANLSINTHGDLNPTNQMAWNWTSGYKFLLLEGLYSPETSDNLVPIVFHIGFSENKKDLEFELSSTNNIQFVIEISELFKNPNTIDFNILPKVLFNKEESSLVAHNYANSFIALEE